MTETDNKRVTPRRRTLIGGTIYRGDEHWACSISDISETGVRVKCSQDFEIGEQLVLKNNKFNDLREAEVKWKREGYIGLNFLVKIDKTNKDVADFFKPFT